MEIYNRIGEELQAKRDLKALERRQFYAGLGIVALAFISLIFS